MVEPQDIANRPAGLLLDPSCSSTMITSGSKVERGQTIHTGETGRDTPSEYRESKPSELVVVPGDRVKRENGDRRNYLRPIRIAGGLIFAARHRASTLAACSGAACLRRID